MRVALLGGGGAAPALAAAGIDAHTIDAAVVPALERVLRARGFTGPLTHVPRALAALRRGGFDVAHAFSAPDALAALLWRSAGGGRVVFTCTEAIDRSNVADRRLRLDLLTRALDEPDAVRAGDERAREALWRWMAIEVPVLDPADAAGHARLYRDLAARP